MITIKLLTVTVLTLGGATAAHCQPPAFYSARLSDDQTVGLFLEQTIAAAEAGFDYDVMIGVGSVRPAGKDHYVDPSAHPAAVRCYEPALVMVAGHEYAIDKLDPSDWKTALWNTVCHAPIS
jgi:hypothetical protein